MPFNTNHKIQIVDVSGDACDDDAGRLNVNASIGVGDTINTYAQVVVGTTAVQLSDSPGISLVAADVKEMIFQAAVDNTGFIMVGDNSVSTDDTRGIRINAGDMLVLPLNNTTSTYLRGSASGQQVNVCFII